MHRQIKAARKSAQVPTAAAPVFRHAAFRVKHPDMGRLLILLLAVLALVLSACGDETKTVTEKGSSGEATTRTVPNVRFAKTKFLVHSGLAFGAFHRYILKPYKAGKLKKGAPGRTKALVKAGVAGAFAAHEVKQARRAALSDDTLRPLVSRVDGVIARLGPLAAALKGGSLNPADLAGAAAAVESLSKASEDKGAPIRDRAVPTLGG